MFKKCWAQVALEGKKVYVYTKEGWQLSCFTFGVNLHVFLARLHEVQKSDCSHHGRTRSHSA